MANNTVEIKWIGNTPGETFHPASMLAEIMAYENKYVQAFPDVTPEIHPPFAVAFNRISDSPIKLHSIVKQAGVVVILSNTPYFLSHWSAELYTRTLPDACFIVNSPLHPSAVKERINFPDSVVYTLEADSIASRDLDVSFSYIPILSLVLNIMNPSDPDHLKYALRELFSSRYENGQFSAILKMIEAGNKEAKKFS